jgi:ribosomal protein L33
MAKKKKGPRQAAGLKCSVCGNFNYITEYNKQNEQLKKQTTDESTFPLNKYCKRCQKSTKHTMAKKLK